MGSNCFDSFVDSLEKDVGPHDYDILFPRRGTERRTRTETRSNLRLNQLLFELIPDIESEVIDHYFVHENNGEVDNLNVTRDHVIATQVDLEAKKKLTEEAEMIARWSNICQSSTTMMDQGKLLELISLPENIFESVISRTNLSTDVLEQILSTTCELPDVPKYKLGILAQYGLLPKICESKVSSRTAVPIYKKLLESTSSEIMLNRVLLPMFKTGATIPRPFFVNIHTDLFFNMAIEWLDEEQMELTSALASTLSPLVDGVKYVDEYVQDIIVKILDRSVRYRPNDEDVAFFFMSVVRKFGELMSEENLKKLQTLNYVNETKMKPKIQASIEKQLSNFETV